MKVGKHCLNASKQMMKMTVVDVSDLLVDQLEFANILLVNKLDLIEEEYKEPFFAFLRKMNPDAEIHTN